ncbi:hypothetical protein JMJ56_13685 [Belnapia sp. T18]|uniref:Uncharacterized protein n=1 Tax=Belnapia arida TaxID=2804533 RepID=A0ABS1U320_9PROT|nr:hypothetical protein [Belnapia arida]MBL6079064.1 hypothetical protein [Belnapia arida]
MSTAKQDNRRAAEHHSGEGGTSNAGGTATGSGSSSASGGKGDKQRDISGSGSDKSTHNRPGHKTQG